MGMGMTTWEWEGLGIVKAIPAHLYTSRSVIDYSINNLFSNIKAAQYDGNYT